MNIKYYVKLMKFSGACVDLVTLLWVIKTLSNNFDLHEYNIKNIDVNSRTSEIMNFADFKNF